MTMTAKFDLDRTNAHQFAAMIDRIALRHQIDAAILENDLDELANLLCIHELDDDIRAVCYVAIDRVSANLGRLVTIDTLLTL